MKTKKMFSMLLALCLLLAHLPTAAFATGTGEAIRLVDKSGAAPAAGTQQNHHTVHAAPRSFRGRQASGSVGWQEH